MSKSKGEVFISLDPGVNYAGFSVNKVTDKKFEVIESILVNNNRAFKADEKELEKIHGGRAVKIMKIVAQLEELLDKYGVDKLIVEAPFYSSLTPVAYGSLLEVIFAIKYLVITKREINMVLVEPTLIKKLFTGKGNASKVMMKDFLVAKFKNGDIVTKVPVEELSEHEIDGVAVGYTHWIHNRGE